MSSGETYTLHVGEDPFPHLSIPAIVEVQADGDELNLIFREAILIVHTNRQVQQWYGDDAKFIVGNLF
jgi:hypothetical protein